MDKIQTPKKPVVLATPEPATISNKSLIAPRPVTTVELPSRGYFYDASVTKNGQIEILPLTARDMKLVAGITGKNVDDVVDTLLKRCLVHSISPDSLLITDRYFLLIMLRANSLGAEVEVSAVCPNEKCKKLSVFKLDLVKDYDVLPVKEGVKEPFEVTLPISKFKVAYHLARGTDVQCTERLVAKLVKDNPAEELGFTASVASLIDTVNDTPVPEDQRLDVVDSLPARDFIMLKKHIDDNTPGMTTNAFKPCPACATTIEMGSPLSAAEFFYPLS